MILTKRELQEILLALTYHNQFSHGTAGHLGYETLAKLAAYLGLTSDILEKLIAEDKGLELPKPKSVE